MESRIEIFDSSLRDGSHAVRHQLTKSQISKYAKLAEEAKIPVIFVGHGDGIGASSIHLDFSLLTDRQMLVAAKKELKNTKLGTFLIPGFGTIKNDLEPIIDLIDYLEIGCHCTEANITRQHMEYAKSKGLKVYGCLMMSHMIEKEMLLEQAKLMQGYGADGVLLMDSAGASLPEDVMWKVDCLVDGLDIPVGYHPHNNLGLAVANAIGAIEAGATIIDGTTRGFGAGAGNCPLEILIAVMDKMGYETGVDFYKLLDASEFIDSFAPPQVISPISIVSGLAGVFSGFAPLAKRAAKRFNVDVRDIFVELGKRKVVAGQEDQIIEVASKLKTSRIEALS